MKLEISKKELEILVLFINGNDNPDFQGIEGTIFWNKEKLANHVEPLRQKLLTLKYKGVKK